MKNIDKSPEWFNRMKENTQPTIDKRLDESIREILKSTNNAVSNSKYSYESKNGKLIIKYNKKKEQDDKTMEAATYRMKYPESSLQELSEIMTLEIGKPITKSGLNHRMRKIKEIANRLKYSYPQE